MPISSSAQQVVHARMVQTILYLVLDVGINFDAEGHMCGDVDFEAVEPLVAAITPVPGGIGSVTTSCTMEHTIVSAERAAL